MTIFKHTTTRLCLALAASSILIACETVKLPWNTGSGAPSVTVAQGELQGTYDPEERIALFKGVPFAAPPVGDLRWAAPRPGHSWEGVREATEFGAECMQARSKGGGVFVRSMVARMGLDEATRDTILQDIKDRPTPAESEDCLFLNIRSANLPVPGEAAPALQPVMVWIHGGSHTAGAGSRPSYQSNTFVDRGIVSVSINYRLGAFGYFAHPALSADNPDGVSGNYGLLDQVAALAWIKENIAQFGGDPDNVTIFGESAGSQSVGELMATPSARGLFHKGILESGVTSGNFSRLKQSGPRLKSQEQAGSDFLVAAKLATVDADATALRAIPAADIIANVSKARRNGVVFLPVADGKVFPLTMGEAIAEHQVADIPTIIGYNTDEGSLFYTWMQGPIRGSYALPKDPAKRLEALRAMYGEGAKTIINEYRLDNPDTRAKGEADMLGDDMFGVHARFLAKEQRARDVPTWFYLFARTPASPDQTTGAYHAAEIPFVFNAHTLTKTDDPADAALTKAIGDYWANFAKTGNPNSDGLQDWPLYNAANDTWLRLDHTIEVVEGVRKTRLDPQEVYLRQQISSLKVE